MNINIDVISRKIKQTAMKIKAEVVEHASQVSNSQKIVNDKKIENFEREDALSGFIAERLVNGCFNQELKEDLNDKSEKIEENTNSYVEQIKKQNKEALESISEVNYSE